MTATASPAQTIDPATRRVAWAVIIGLIAPILDTTITTIALETLGRDLDVPVSTIQWVSTGYLLALAVAVPLAGWAATRFGSRVAWIAGLLIFLLGSVLCAMAWDAPSLIAFRVLQGLGAGLIMPLMMSILVSASRGVALGQVIALVSMPTALGPILGPVLGGVILNWLNWRWLFLINVPIVAVALYLARRIPDDDRTRGADDHHAHLDVVGLLLLAPGLALILLGLSNAHAGFVSRSVMIPLIVGVITLGVFVVRSLVSARQGIVDIRILAHRAVAASSAGLFAFGIASFGAMFLLPLFFQQVFGDSVLRAALYLIPQGVGAFVTRGVAGKLTDRFGGRWVAACGFVIVAAATVPFAFADAGTSVIWLMIALLFRGLGLGLLLSPIMAAGFIGVPDSARQDTSMLTRITQQLGGSFGTAILAVVVMSAASVAAGFSEAFWWSVVFALVGAVLALMLPSRPTLTRTA
ncbi:MDR family MFS transporter [Gordonia sp. w5E2]|uniref:Multidrug transporter n=1 Tax=Gordonia jacobaea TaxID=122202 RepID=A0ABR5IAP9_9ACTN|nr:MULTISPECIES: MDR family MFS transporter [Gordonia]KNA90751.1 multidrug transporter [Gordonia jacobaea]SKZ57892.1 integral membrane drug efflux protein [Mycobacteroides abscessus subsp. abscessus]